MPNSVGIDRVGVRWEKNWGDEMLKHMSNLASDMEATTNPNKVSKKRKKKKRRSPEMAKALRY